MNTIRHLFTLAAILATASLAPAAVPSAINYQGRLSNASGASQQGNRAMSVKLYDAGSGGTLLYSENLGNVAVDANGVYAFQFGASGSSDTLVSETLATTDGTAATYQKTLSHTPVLPGTVGVADGTFSWHETTGNPGSPAHATATVMYGFVVEAKVTNGGSGYTTAPAVTITGNGTGAAATAAVAGGAVTEITITSAGSGYTTGATIAIAPPPAPFVVNYTAGTVTVTYDPAPPAGRAITATYRYSTTGISGALAAGAEQWLELTVDGVAQSPRQKVLAVPFAMRADVAEETANLSPSDSFKWRPEAWTRLSEGNFRCVYPIAAFSTSGPGSAMAGVTIPSYMSSIRKMELYFRHARGGQPYIVRIKKFANMSGSDETVFEKTISPSGNTETVTIDANILLIDGNTYILELTGNYGYAYSEITNFYVVGGAKQRQ